MMSGTLTKTPANDAADEVAVDRFLIDTHCHLDDAAFADDLDQVLAASRAAGVNAWIQVGFEPARWQSSIDLVERTPGMALMLGVHPSSVDLWSPQVAAELRRLVAAHGAVAIGEIGLDFFWDGNPSLETQRAAFTAQLDLARELGLPAVIHMRNAEDEILTTLRGREPQPLLFHSYDGGPALTDIILEWNAYVGVGGLATKAKSDALREQLLRIPLDRIVLETDSPYLIPARMRGRRNTPASVRRISEFLGTLRAESAATIASITTTNALNLFPMLSERVDLE
ncbi:MAG: TatD family hydrolase [Thermomicrobiales bacterium]